VQNVKESQMSQPTLAMIDVEIRSGQDEIAREAILANLKGYCEECVQPLWVNLLRERADLRIVCLVRDLSQLDNFLIDVIRSAPGVRGTSAHLAFGGVVHGSVINELPLQDAPGIRQAAATVSIKTEPGFDRQAYKTLVALNHHPDVRVGFVLKVFHSPETDIQMLLLGDRTTSLTGFVMGWIRTVPGVLDTSLTSTVDWQIIGKPDDFVELAQCFPVTGMVHALS
jgi:hypothetical protein